MDLFLLGKTPIHPENPTGSDIRYDPDFELLQAEIDKLSSPSSTNGIDWKKVSDLSARILSEKSKDLMAASYLAVAQIHLNQIDGFAVGTTVLRDLFENYWETLFPPKKRMRGRAGAVYFWVEKVEPLLGSMNIKVDSEIIDTIDQSITELDTFFNESLPDPPSLHSIKRRLQNLKAQTAQTAEPPSASEPGAETSVAPNTEAAAQAVYPPEPKKPAPPKPEPARIGTAESGGSASEQDVLKNVNAAFQAIRSAGLFFFEQDAKNADAYRFRRIAVWAKVSALPPENGGKTQIPPPSGQEMTALKDLKSAGNWHLLLQTTEQKLSRFIYWFDLGRLSAEVLLKLGPEYQKAHAAVCDETAFFLHRVPGIEALSFSDGTPFADSETRQWIKDIALGGMAAEAGEISIADTEASSQESEQMSEVMEKAKSLAREQKTMAAVSLIQSHLRQSQSERRVLSWRMALIQILIGSEFKHLAVPHIEQVVADIDRYRLEAWEPAIALNGLTLAWSGFSALTDNRFTEQANQLLNRIARLDPAEAVRISR